MPNIFQQLEFEAFRKGITPRTKQSIAWFRKRAEDMTAVNRKRLIREEPIEQVSKFLPGNMYMYFYDPKHKMTLPYYDTFPLIVLVDSAPGGFYGLNLHYLPPVLRARLLDGLMDNLTNKKFDETTRIKVNYDLLQASSKLNMFKPCYKHYLTSHMRSKFAYIPPPEWEIATFLPTADFKKASENKVWKDSRGMI